MDTIWTPRYHLRGYRGGRGQGWVPCTCL